VFPVLRKRKGMVFSAFSQKEKLLLFMSGKKRRCGGQYKGSGNKIGAPIIILR
jgi:hypothetical protein